jgi:hypothetical protein
MPQVKAHSYIAVKEMYEFVLPLPNVYLAFATVFQLVLL